MSRLNAIYQSNGLMQGLTADHNIQGLTTKNVGTFVVDYQIILSTNFIIYTFTSKAIEDNGVLLDKR